MRYGRWMLIVLLASGLAGLSGCRSATELTPWQLRQESPTAQSSGSPPPEFVTTDDAAH